MVTGILTLKRYLYKGVIPIVKPMPQREKLSFKKQKTVKTAIFLPLSDYLVLWTLAKSSGKGIRELASEIVRNYLEKKKWELASEIGDYRCLPTSFLFSFSDPFLMRIRDYYFAKGVLAYVILEEGDPEDELRIWHIHSGGGVIVFHEHVLRPLGDRAILDLRANRLTCFLNPSPEYVIPCDAPISLEDGKIVLRIPKEDFERVLEDGDDLSRLFESLEKKEEKSTVSLILPL